MADGQHLLCSVFLQRLRWSAYWRMDHRSSRFAYAYGYCDSHSNTDSYSYADADTNSNGNCNTYTYGNFDHYSNAYAYFHA